MMFKIKCRCGKMDKHFQKNIGEFFVAECCEQAGFDHLGEPKVGTSAAETKPTVTDKVIQLVDSAKVTTQVVGIPVQLASPTPPTQPVPSRTNPNRPGRGKLRDMRREDVANVAAGYGIPVTETMTKAQIIDEIHR
jgi:hypothetical protein